MRLLISTALLLAAPTCLTWPAIAQAEALLPQRGVAGTRIIGTWQDNQGITYILEDAVLRVKGRAVRRATGEVLATFELSPHPTEGVRGPFEDRITGQKGFISAYHNGDGPVIFVREGLFLNRRPSESINLRTPADVARVSSAWIGKWRTSRGPVELVAEQKVVAGHIESERGRSFVALLPEGEQAYGGWEGSGSGDVELRLASDGRSFRGWYTDLSSGRSSRLEWTGERITSPTRPAPTNAAIPQQLMDRFAGDWDMQDSIVQILPEGTNAMLLVNSRRSGRTLYSMPLSAGQEPGSLEGTDTGMLGGDRLRFRLTLQRDGNGIDARDARYAGTAGQLFWTAKRISAQPAPSEPAPPAPAPQPSPTAPAESGTTAGFQPLRQFEVRLDRLWEARGYPTRQVHAFVTIKNVSARPQYITSGFLKAVLTDADGVAQERNQVWRASAEPAALFNSTPVVQPGAELKIRYVFNPDAGAMPDRLTLFEGDSRAEFQGTAR
jgi:hypothetical protein